MHNGDPAWHSSANGLPGAAAAILVLTAATFLVAAFGLRSRKLASLAAISLLASATAVTTISLIPSGHGSRTRLFYMIIVMFPAGVLKAGPRRARTSPG